MVYSSEGPAIISGLQVTFLQVYFTGQFVGYFYVIVSLISLQIIGDLGLSQLTEYSCKIDEQGDKNLEQKILASKFHSKNNIYFWQLCLLYFV